MEISSVSDRDALIALSLLPFLTPARTRLLFEAYVSAAGLFNASPAALASLLGIDAEQAALLRGAPSAFRREVEALRTEVIAVCDEGYPPLLHEIADPPLVLHVRGDASLLSAPSVAIVGSRRASPYGINAAARLACDLAEAGVVVVSGLARGIDGAAHASTLDAKGKTVAVLGTGIDVAYPREHARLHDRVAREGVLVSEFAPGTIPRAQNFPFRNRIISGLSLGTVIVEATSRSGSLITARLAAEQGREVFAVPGPIFSAASEGPHRLIQYGAKLVHDVGDIFDEIASLPRPVRAARKEVEKVDPELKEVLNIFRHDEPVAIDEAALRLERSVSSLAAPLLALEMSGWLRAVPGARYVRVK